MSESSEFHVPFCKTENTIASKDRRIGDGDHKQYERVEPFNFTFVSCQLVLQSGTSVPYQLCFYKSVNQAPLTQWNVLS